MQSQSVKLSLEQELMKQGYAGTKAELSFQSPGCVGVGGFITPWCWEVDLLNSSQFWKEEIANIAPALPVLCPRAQGVGMT